MRAALLDAQGKPRPGIWVNVANTPGRFPQELRTDSEGRITSARRLETVTLRVWPKHLNDQAVRSKFQREKKLSNEDFLALRIELGTHTVTQGTNEELRLTLPASAGY